MAENQTAECQRGEFRRMGVNQSFESIRGKGDEKGIMVCRGGLFLQRLQRLIWKQRKRGSIERACWWFQRRNVLSKEWEGMGGGWRDSDREWMKKGVVFSRGEKQRCRVWIQGFKDVHQSLCKDEARQCGSWQLVVSGYGRKRESERRVTGAYNQVYQAYNQAYNQPIRLMG